MVSVREQGSGVKRKKWGGKERMQRNNLTKNTPGRRSAVSEKRNSKVAVRGRYQLCFLTGDANSNEEKRKPRRYGRDGDLELTGKKKDKEKEGDYESF